MCTARFKARHCLQDMANGQEKELCVELLGACLSSFYRASTASIVNFCGTRSPITTICLTHTSPANANPNTAMTPPLTRNCDAAPGKGTMVGEVVGLEGVEVAVKVPFPVTFKFKQICLTKVPNAASHQQVFFPFCQVII